MKIDKRRPIDCDPTLMNARRREKKQLLTKKSKPQRASEWVALGDHMKKWFEEHKEEMSFISGLHKISLTWSQIKSWRLESEDFNEAVAYCLQLCQTRREAYLHAEGKLSHIYLREHPLYVPALGEYESSLKEKSQQGTDRIVIMPAIPTPEDKK